MPTVVVSGISPGFPGLFRCEGQIAHVLLTRSPLVYSRRSLTARLACVKHAASVRPEPGSNSPLKSFGTARGGYPSTEFPDKCVTYQRNRHENHRPRPVSSSTGRYLVFVDFWHTVEFSSIGRTPAPGPGGPNRGQLV